MRRILVLGSLNIDLVQHIPHIAAPGETVRGSDLQFFAGGKGANQACAAALLGAQVQMAGKVGDDSFAERLTEELRRAGVDTGRVARSSASSGAAIINILPGGENTIVISPGANSDVAVDFALRAIEDLQANDLLLCQLEIPLEAVQAAMHGAFKKNVTTILDPAPASPLPNDLLSCVSILTPNQSEVASLLGASQAPVNFAQAEAAARQLQGRGPKRVIVKMGSQGCFILDGDSTAIQPAFQVEAVDTTAAGDTFNGALAAALWRGDPFLDSVRFAAAAAALSVTKPGAIASIPSLAETNALLSTKGSKQ